MTDNDGKPYTGSRNLSQPDQSKSRALRAPEGVDKDRTAIMQLLDMAGRRMKTNAATRVQEAENRLLHAQVEQGKAMEDLLRQADRVLNIEAIIDDDRAVFDAQAERNRSDYDEALHEAKTAQTRREREEIEEEIKLERARRQLEEMRNPPKPSDDRARIAELSEKIKDLTERLSDEGMGDELRDELNQKRRGLVTELEILLGRNGG